MHGGVPVHVYFIFNFVVIFCISNALLLQTDATSLHNVIFIHCRLSFIHHSGGLIHNWPFLMLAADIICVESGILMDTCCCFICLLHLFPELQSIRGNLDSPNRVFADFFALFIFSFFGGRHSRAANRPLPILPSLRSSPNAFLNTSRISHAI